jgi:hypothetical protein
MRSKGWGQAEALEQTEILREVALATASVGAATTTVQDSDVSTLQ